MGVQLWSSYQGNYMLCVRLVRVRAVWVTFYMSKWFCDTFTGATTAAARCGSLLEGILVSWSLAMNEHSRYEDLRGSNRWSIIPYVHGRTELYCSSLSIYPEICF
jgi:hypothetical protein